MMAIAAVFPLFQALAMNLISGLIYTVALDPLWIQLRSELPKHTCWHQFLGLFMRRVKAVTNGLNRKWIAVISCKSAADILTHYYTQGENAFFFNSIYFGNSELAKISILLSPVSLLLICLISKSEFEFDVASGLAWGFYHGYLKITAKFLTNCINNSRYALELNKLPKRFILFPTNGQLINALNDADDRITFIENTPSLKKELAGIKERVYFQSVYKFTPRCHEFEEFHCIVEQAASVGTINQLRERGCLSKKDAATAITKFYEIVEHCVEQDELARKTFELILYSGETEDLVDAIAARRKNLMNTKRHE